MANRWSRIKDIAVYVILPVLIIAVFTFIGYVITS